MNLTAPSKKQYEHQQQQGATTSWRWGEYFVRTPKSNSNSINSSSNNNDNSNVGCNGSKT